MIICKTVEEFIDNIINNDKTFFELTFENEEQYKELYEYLINNNEDKDNLFVLGLMYISGKFVDRDDEKAFEYIKQSAEGGNVRAMLVIGMFYENGIGCEKNEVFAFEWYKKAAQNNHLSAMKNLVYFYENGIGCEKNLEFAYAWSNKAKNIELAEEYYEVAYILENITSNEEYAFSYYKKSADAGDIDALYRMARYYEEGILCNQDYELAFKMYEMAVEFGHIDAVFHLALCYAEGKGCEQNLELAFYWYEKSAEYGNINAMNCLAVCYYNGTGCERDLEKAFKYFEKAANLHNEIAMYNLGVCYEEGSGCEQNLELAFKWYKKAAELKNAEAMCALGKCYEHGKGCEQNLELAFEWYKKAVELENADAMYEMGKFCENGIVCEQNFESAFKWYEKAANLEVNEAIYALGRCYEFGIGCEQNCELAFKQYEKGAAKKDANSMYALGLCYYNGKGCEQNSVLAYIWFKLSAKLENAEAMYYLAACYEKGSGCERNLELAFEWYQKSADSKNAKAMCKLADCYTNGEICEQNYELAFMWYTKSAEAGDIDAMNELALCYYAGKGCEENLELAYVWFETSAKLGNTEAMYNLANCYENGEGCEQDLKLAFEWYKKSAELENAKAMYRLAECYKKGKGCEQDYELAFEWYKKSAELGNKDSIEELAICYEQGRGCEQNYELALKYYVKSRNSKYFYKIGFFYENGIGCKKNVRHAFFIYCSVSILGNDEEKLAIVKSYNKISLLANDGDVDSMVVLAYCFEQGLCCEQNYELAFEWYKKAAELDDIYSIIKIAEFYENGRGCEKNIKAACYWYLKAVKLKELDSRLSAKRLEGLLDRLILETNSDKEFIFQYYKELAELGHASAMYKLGKCYKYGIGCEKNEQLACEWYIKAVKKGDKSAENRVKYLLTSLETRAKTKEDRNFILKCYQELADLNVSYAQEKMGFFYHIGKYVDKNIELAIYWYKKAANQKNEKAIIALYLLAESFEEGKNQKQDYKKALEIYQITAELGHVNSMFKLGLFYAKGLGQPHDYQLAMKWFQKAAEKGDKVAMFNVAVLYANGQGCKKNSTLAFEWYKKSADKGYPTAMYNLGVAYEEGFGCEKNSQLAFEWFLKAADLGNLNAKYKVAVYRTSEYGSELAFELYKKGANSGNSDDMLNVANCYKNGNGCKQDYKLAFEWYKKAVEHGNTAAIYPLAMCYKNGHGCEQDLKLAFKYFNEIAETGDANAMYEIALCYSEGKGCEQNLEIAFEWYEKAADAGNTISMYYLGKCFEDGIGCAKNLHIALEWYEKAYESGNEYAREDVERVKEIIEREALYTSKLVFGARKEVFISWNHLDKKIKDDLCENLEKNSFLTVWESDGNGVGDINENIKNAILSSRSYIVLLTGNSIKSKWVEKEIELILSKIEKMAEYKNVIRPIILNEVDVRGKKKKCDVIKKITHMKETSPFKKLLNLCASFEDFEIGLNYENISSFLREAIGNSLKIEYKNMSLKELESFSSALNTVVSSRETKNGIIAATLNFESGYLYRDIYDKYNKPICPYQLLDYESPSMIYGEGGTGKSLYLKNFMRQEFKGNKYIFFLECRRIENVKDDFTKNLKQYAFDIYFDEIERNQVTIDSFEQLFNTTNNVIVLVDALDEISYENRKLLLEKINYFYQKTNAKLIFSSRNKKDAGLINMMFSTEIKYYELRGIGKEDIELLYDNLSKKYITKEKFDSGEIIVFDPVKFKETFLEKIQKISEDIKKNPLLISNLIFIYFATHKIPDTVFDIINESVLILIKDLEEERALDFEYRNYIQKEKLNHLLGYLALQRAYGNKNSAELIIKEYIIKRYSTESIDHSKIGEKIYKYLRRRAIIVNEKISHEIFANYFISAYLFSLIYILEFNNIEIGYYNFKDKGIEKLEDLCERYFLIDDEKWNNIAIDLLYKLDFEIYNLNTEVEMNEKHLSYEAFNTTLIKTLTEEGYNKTTINIIKNILDKVSFHYNEFIKRYIK